MSRPSAAALAATRVSCCAVTAPDATPSTVMVVAHRAGDPGSPAVHDGDDDAQHAPGQLVGVAVVAHGDVQIPWSPRPLRCGGARSAQRGRGIRVLLGADYESGGNPQ